MVDCRDLAEGKVLQVKSTGTMDYCWETNAAENEGRKCLMKVCC